MSASKWITVGAILAAFVVWCALVITVYPPPEPIETTVEEVVEVERTVDQYVEVDIERAYRICSDQRQKADRAKNEAKLEAIREALDNGETVPRPTPEPPDTGYVSRDEEEVGEDGVCRVVPGRED